jgi:hypothetical protein
MGKQRSAALLPWNPVRQIDITGTQEFIGPEIGPFIAMNPSCCAGEFCHRLKLRVTVC